MRFKILSNSHRDARPLGETNAALQYWISIAGRFQSLVQIVDFLAQADSECKKTDVKMGRGAFRMLLYDVGFAQQL